MGFPSACPRATERERASQKANATCRLNFLKGPLSLRPFLPFSVFTLMTFLSWSKVALARPQITELRVERASGGNVVFQVELAASDAEKAKGLMFRTKLGDGEGMLFPYGRSQEITMWMRNTYISLDMIFIRADGVIHRIEAQTEPLSDRVIASNGDVFAVLEIAGGGAERHGIRPGDRVMHPALPAKAPR